MQGKTLAIGLLAALIVAIAGVFLLGLTGGSRHVPKAPPGVAFATGGGPPSGVQSAASGGAVKETIRDRAIRDDVRRRILAAWADGDAGELAAAGRSGKIPPMPTTPEGAIDPKYIQDVVRSDYFPMAAKCYEELLTRHPDAGGTVTLDFKILGDESVGGVVDELEVHAADSVADERLTTCIRESMLSLAFRPPPDDGWVTITYPIVFAPDEPH